MSGGFLIKKFVANVTMKVIIIFWGGVKCLFKKAKKFLSQVTSAILSIFFIVFVTPCVGAKAELPLEYLKKHEIKTVAHC